MAESDKKTECVKVWMSEKLFVDLNRAAIVTGQLSIFDEQAARAAPDMGRQLGEAGMQRTLEAEREEWIARAIEALRRFSQLPGWQEFTIEAFRVWWLVEGGPAPHSHKVWGALTNRASSEGIIRFTGKYQPSVSPKTHGHPVKCWCRA